MGTLSAAILVATLFAVCLHHNGIGIDASESFVRSAVESPPEPFVSEKLAIELEPAHIGDQFLPLRSAVESAPIQKASSTQSFIRSSVEYRPIESESLRLDNEPQAQPSDKRPTSLHSDRYSAFFVPSRYDRNPQPFRSGSPYQQLFEHSASQIYQQFEQLRGGEPLSQTRIADTDAAPKKVLCYVTNWSFYRLNDGKFVPEHIRSDLCSHVIYSFGSLDPQTLRIREFDPWADVQNNLYRRTTALPVKTLLALGGWTDSTGDKYSRLISSAAQIRSFVDSTVAYLQKYGFSGLHMDWNYPRCWQSDCRKGPAVDKPNFTRLIQALAASFRKQSPPLELGVAISGYKEVIVEAYEVAKLSQAADFLTVMTYDYHGAWESETGHVSPLYAQPGDKYPQYNTDYTMQLLLKAGADPAKLIMGVPFYGQTYTLEKPGTGQVVGEGTPARGPGNPGEFTRQPGMMAYYEICDQLRKKKLVAGRAKAQTRQGQHASSRDQWVGYEDPNSIAFKAEYVMKNGFGGIAAWTIDLDDFHNVCCFESFPLLRAVNRGLGRLQSSSPPSAGDCRRPEEPVTPVAPVMEAAGEHGGGAHEHTTWQEWKPASSTTPTTPVQTSTTARPSSTWWTQPTTTQRTTTPQTTTTTVKPVTWWTTKPTTTTAKPTTTTTVRPTQPIIPGPVNTQPIVIEGESCQVGEYRAHPRDCTAYFRCVFGTMTQLHCAGQLHWNSRDQFCDWPARANCKLSLSEDVITSTSTTRRPATTTVRTTTRRTTTTVRTTTQRTVPTKQTTATTPRPTKKTTLAPRPTPKPTASRPGRPPVVTQSSPVADACTPGQYYPHPDCSRFYVCVNNKLIAQDCGPGLQWSQQQLGCDRASVVHCVSRTHKLMRLVSARIAPADLCEGNVHISYPGACDKYLLCNHGQLQMGECAPGLHWNERGQICDWPLSAQCSQEESGAVDGGDDNNLPDFDGPTTTTRKPTTTTRKPKPPTTPRPPLTPHSGHYKLVCYFTNWAWYRSGVGKYTPDNIDTDLCTHIVYGFAVLDVTELTIRTHDSWADLDNKFYDRVARLREKGVVVSLALGGWNDSQGDKYSRLVRSAAARAKFVRHVTEFVERYGFGGLDLDWEYPVCWQTECKKGFADEREGFAELVQELSDAFRPRGLLLSTAVSPSKQIIDAGYDVPRLAELFDWIAVMTYDFHGQWDKKTGHVAPLFYHEDDDISYFNANFSINYWMEKGAPARKLVMGMPLYGQSFTLSDAKNTGLNSRAPGPGQAGEYTRAAGFLAYYEICDRVRNRDWEVVQDPQGRMGPYAYKGNQWVSYDDKQMLIRKSQMIRAMGLGGGMVWALDLDDFKNHCGEGVHPLLTEIQRVLRDPPQPHESNGAIAVITAPVPQPQQPPHSSELSPDTPNVAEADNVDASIESQPPASQQPAATDSEFETSVDNEISGETPTTTDKGADYKVVCYFTNWAWYRQGGGKFLPEDIDAQLCTHVIYGFAVLNRETLTIQPHDSWADIDNKFYDRVVAYKAKGIKVSVAIGGWNDSAGDKYSRLVRSAASRARFIKHVLAFIEKYQFDGLDLDWEYPVCWQVDCKKGFADEKQGFAALVRELSAVLRPRGLLLSSAVSPSAKVIDAAYDVPVLSAYMDWIAVMTYDYHGQWDKQTGHVAPMYEHEDDFDTTFNANYSINYWISAGADREKLVMGMPMYGQSFSLADNAKNGLNQATYGGGEAGDGTRARGFLAYYEICERVQQRGWKVVRDRKGRMGPYAYRGDQWVSFDDGNMIRHKSEFVRAMGLGGAMIWALDLGDFRNTCDCEEYPMLRTINRVLRGYVGARKTCQLMEQSQTEVLADRPSTQQQQPTRRPQVAAVTHKPTLPSTRRPQVVAVTHKPQLPPKAMIPAAKPSEFNYDCNQQQFRAHDSDCNKYYQCQFGSLLVQSCPPGLHWNRDHCDWPRVSDCQGSPSDADNVIVSSGIVATQPPTKRPIVVTTTVRTTRKPATPPAKSTSRPNPIYTKPPGSTTPISNDVRGPRVVCYFTNWAWYRRGDGKYTPDDIDESLCTHIVYGFAVLNRETLTMRTHDSWADIDNRFYERVVALRAKGIRVTLALGGWNDSLGDKYSRLVLNATARARFVRHAVEFIEQHGFEGLDLDWEYPVCWQVDCAKGQPAERAGFAALVRELSAAFRPRGWLLSAAVSANKVVIDAAYDVPALARDMDWIAVMAYDYHGHWDKATGHVAPLYYVPGDANEYWNANFSMRYWIEKGAPPTKLIMGMPLYGQSFAVVAEARGQTVGLNAKSSGPGSAGKFTRAAGFLAYYEICERINAGGWTVMRDQSGRIGPYAHRGNEWFSYDDVEDIRRKVRFAKELGLGGGMVWALDLDDFRGRCGCGKHPLLRALNQEFGLIEGQRAKDCT